MFQRIHREAFRIKAWRFLVFFFPSSKGSSASECCYVDVKTYKLLWRSIFLAQQPGKKIHTYTQHTNMQAIIPVSNQSRVTICRSSCTSFLVFLLLVFFFVALFWLCFARVNHCFFFNMAVFGSISLTWNSVNRTSLSVHMRVYERQGVSSVSKWLVFVSLKLRKSLRYFLSQSLTVSKRGNSTFFMSLC